MRVLSSLLPLRRARAKAVIATAATAALLAGATLVPTACTPVVDGPTYDRTGLLATWTDDVVMPAHAAFATKSAALLTAVENLCTAPSAENVDAARAARLEASLAWQKTAAFRFGPAKDQRAQNNLDLWPFRPDAVDAALAANPAPTRTSVAEQGAASLGLHAAAYMLSQEPDAQSTADALAAEGGKRCAYLDGLAADIASRATNIEQAWLNGYAADYKAAKGFDTEQLAVDEIVNGIVAYAEWCADTKLGKPLDKRGGGDPRPDEVEEPYALTSKEQLQAALAGLGDLMRGEGRFLSVLEGVRPDLATRLERQLEGAEAAVAAIDGPIKTVVADDTQQIWDAYNAIKAFYRLAAVEAVAAMGVTLTFNTNDGD